MHATSGAKVPQKQWPQNHGLHRHLAGASGGENSIESWDSLTGKKMENGPKTKAATFVEMMK